MNSWWGCTKISPGCQNCYAATLDARYHAADPHWGPNASRLLASESTWRAPFRWDAAAAESGERPRVFAFSMGDWAEAWKRAELRPAVARLFATIALTPNLDWLLLTKRPADALELLNWGPMDALVTDWADRLRSGPSSSAAAREGWKPLPAWTRERIARIGVSRVLAGAAWWPNVWHGVTVEDQKRADERIPLLLKFNARVRWLSCEPLIGPVILGAHRHLPNAPALSDLPNDIDWVVVGGESGAKARPFNLEWAKRIVDDCKSAGVPAFVKQLGSNTIADLHPGSGWLDDWTNQPDPERWTRLTKDPNDDRWRVRLRSSGGTFDEFPDALRVREFPAPARVIA
jgi:protein gp37